ncbi:MAG: hypothetical protein JHC84_02090 [Solirubrobacteraceae bacterium]|nr:hypothetical protein [Solirubrobacteraceae bacterium]
MVWLATQVARVCLGFGGLAVVALVIAGILLVFDGTALEANGGPAMVLGGWAVVLVVAWSGWQVAMSVLARRGSHADLLRARGDSDGAAQADRAERERVAQLPSPTGCLGCGETFPTVQRAMDHVAREHDDGDMTEMELHALVVGLRDD